MSIIISIIIIIICLTKPDLPCADFVVSFVLVKISCFVFHSGQNPCQPHVPGSGHSVGGERHCWLPWAGHCHQEGELDRPTALSLMLRVRDKKATQINRRKRKDKNLNTPKSKVSSRTKCYEINANAWNWNILNCLVSLKKLLILNDHEFACGVQTSLFYSLLWLLFLVRSNTNKLNFSQRRVLGLEEEEGEMAY